MDRDRPSDEPPRHEGITSGDPLRPVPPSPTGDGPAGTDPGAVAAGAGIGGPTPEGRADPGPPEAAQTSGWTGPTRAPETPDPAGWAGSAGATSAFGAGAGAGAGAPPRDAPSDDVWTSLGTARPGMPPAPAGYGAGPVPPGAWGDSPLAPRPVYELASWGRRAGAFLIDGVLVGIVATVLLVVMVGAFGGVGFLGGDETGYVGLVLGALVGGLVAFLVSLLYAPLWMARTNGRTLGRQVMGIRVVRTNGRPTDFWWSALRESVLKALVFGGLGFGATFGLAWLADVLWPLWDDQNRALHDFVVDSRVVRD